MSDLQQTHHEECWRQRRHHDCAVRKIERLTALVKVLESDDHEWYLQAARIERLTAENKDLSHNGCIFVNENADLRDEIERKDAKIAELKANKQVIANTQWNAACEVYKGEIERLTADNERLRAALREIANSKFCMYENTESGQYGIGVTDGHRYCANIAKEALAAVEGKT